MNPKVGVLHHFYPIYVIHQSQIQFIAVNVIILIWFIFKMMPPEIPISSVLLPSQRSAVAMPTQGILRTITFLLLYHVVVSLSIKGPRCPSQWGPADGSSASLLDMQQRLDSYASLAGTLKPCQPLTESLPHQWLQIVTRLLWQRRVKRAALQKAWAEPPISHPPVHKARARQEVILTRKHGEVSWCESGWFQRGRTGWSHECFKMEGGNKQKKKKKSISEGKIILEGFPFYFFIWPCVGAGGRIYIWCLRATRWCEIHAFSDEKTKRREERRSSGNLSNLLRLLQAFVSEQEEELQAQQAIFIFQSSTQKPTLPGS